MSSGTSISTAQLPVDISESAQTSDADFRTRRRILANSGDRENFQSNDTVESLFGPIRYTVASPLTRVTISCEYAIDICDELIKVLKLACKVPITPVDSVTLIHVTGLQIEAKLWFASIATSSSHFSKGVEARASRVKDTFPVAIYPLSLYLEQIGSLEFNGQLHIPSMFDLTHDRLLSILQSRKEASIPNNIIELPDGNRLSDFHCWCKFNDPNAAREAGIIVLDEDGNTRFTKEFLAEPYKYPWVGNMDITLPRPIIPDAGELMTRYNNLLGRIAKKLPGVTVPVDYHAKGTAALLTTCKLIANTTQAEVWSSRCIDDEALILGGILRYGHNLAGHDDFHANDNRCREAVVEVAGTLLRFVKNVTRCYHQP